MSKQQTQNTFNDGLNLDLHPIVTPNSVLTDNLNGTYITYNGNEFCLQNDRGNDKVASLTAGYTPIGIKEHNGVLYIISCNDDGYAEIGTYPGLEWDKPKEKIRQFIDSYTVLGNYKRLVEDFRVKLTGSLSGIDRHIIEDLCIENFEFTTEELENFLNGIDALVFYNETDRDLLTEELYVLSIPYSEFFGHHYEYNNFTTDKLNLDKKHPLQIEIQDSYDGSVNLIFTDNKNIPRIVNSAFSVLSGNTYKLVERSNNSNIYQDSTLDVTTNLIETTTSFPKIIFNNVFSGGQLKGGNYTIVLKYGDDDGNVTDVVAESGVISVFKNTGVYAEGTVSNESAGKSIILDVANLDTSYKNLYVYYTREFSDTEGYLQTEAAALINKFPYSGTTTTITIDGTEPINSISIEDLNITYHAVSAVKTLAQQQDMLFLGNVSQNYDNLELKDLSYTIRVYLEQKSDSIGWVDYNYSVSQLPEYYDPGNIYKYLGYWPDEYYRFGIVYILKDGTLTSAYNLLGTELTSSSLNNITGITLKQNGAEIEDGFLIDPGTEQSTNNNIYGVFKTPEDIKPHDYANKTIKPLYFHFELPNETIESLQQLGVSGYFIVRQKRSPMTYCQGIGTYSDKYTGVPQIYRKREDDSEYLYTQSFVTPNTELINYSINIPVGANQIVNEAASFGDYVVHDEDFSQANVTDEDGNNPITFVNDPLYYHYRNGAKVISDTRQFVIHNSQWYRVYMTGVWHYVQTSTSEISFLANAYNVNPFSQEGFRDSFLNPDLGQIYTNQTGMICVEKSNENCNNILLSADPILVNNLRSIINGNLTMKLYADGEFDMWNRGQIIAKGINRNIQSSATQEMVFVEPNSSKYINNKYYTTIIGNQYSVQEQALGIYGIDPSDTDITNISNTKRSIIRGMFVPFVAVNGKGSFNWELSTINIRKRTPVNDDSTKYEMKQRFYDNSPFYSISDREPLTTNALDVYRGDCFSNTVTLRYIRNFVNETNPTGEIVDYETLKDAINGKTYWSEVDWTNVSIGDVNNAKLGVWIVYKCCSNYNLGLRSTNSFDTKATADFGVGRDFFPHQTINNGNKYKQEETWLHNNGYDITVGRIRNQVFSDVPYIKNVFSTRVMFSNINVTDQFINGYRVFQGVSYRDYDKQYGEIVKLLPWGNNLFCVFEHGLALLPINEKALMQTTTEQTIHIYGHGVLPDQMSIISQDFGTQYADSIIKTPIGIYGLDVDARKAWRFSDRGFETLSDMKIETFLNNNLPDVKEDIIEIEYTDVRTHYNAFKGDVIFTWYYQNEEFSICFNERQNIWTTRYDWLPIISENRVGQLYSLYYDGNGNYHIYKHDITSKPDYWYDKQHTFEFEFVVSDPIGLHKIFENLQIISNNVQPEELKFEIIGDSYMFNKDRIYHYTWDRDQLPINKQVPFDKNRKFGHEPNNDQSDIDPNHDPATTLETKSKLQGKFNLFKNASRLNDRSGLVEKAHVIKEQTTEQYHIVIPQECRNVETWGVILGNLKYRDDSWLTTIEPLIYDASLDDPNSDLSHLSGKWRSAKIRDKWCKIRVRYSGTDLAVITAIKTTLNI